MAELIARRPLLIGLREYLPGDALPQGHPDAEEWVKNRAAVWRDDDYAPPDWTPAKLAAAIPGLPGLAVGGEATGEDLMGKVPVTEQRRKPRCKRPASKT